MGKSSKRKGQETATSRSAVDKRISRVIRRLGLIDSRCTEEVFYHQAEQALGSEALEEWFEQQSSGSYESTYDFQYSTVERALVCSVSWRSWPLEVELRWLIPRLEEALKKAAPERQYLVEIGAGPGAAAAIVSSVLGVPVISTDTHPGTLGLAEELAKRTQGEVQSVVVEASHVAETFREEPPAAVFGLGVFRYALLEHQHQPTVFSYLNSAAGFMSQTPPPEVVKFFESIAPADLLLAEQMCADYLGEVGCAGASTDYTFTPNGVARLDHQLPDGPTSSVCVHLACNIEPSVVDSPIVQLAGELPPIRSGLSVKDLQAEVLRRQLNPVEQLECAEFSWKNGSGDIRREFFNFQGMFGCYTASTIAYRELRLVDANKEATLRASVTLEEGDYGSPEHVDRRELSEPSSAW